MNKKLMLCAGPVEAPGYTRLDANPEHNPEIVATIPPLPQIIYDMGPWDLIELIHGIEHFERWDVPGLLREIHTALRPGGMLVLEQPNILVAARILAGTAKSPTKDPIESTMWALYGDPSHRDPGYMHKWGYTPQTLTDLLKECAPWSLVSAYTAKHHQPKRDFRVEAIK